MPLGMGREAPSWREGRAMSNDFSKTLDDLTRRRRHYNFVTTQAPVLLDRLVTRAKAINLVAYEIDRIALAQCAVSLADELFKALPPNPDDPPSPAAVAEMDIPPLPPSHGAPRRPVADRLRSLADCKQTCDPGVIERYHAHLASSGLQDCGACGARLDVAAHDLLPAEPEATHHAVQH